MKSLLISVLLVIASGCSPESYDDFQREGERWSKEMSYELDQIQTREELVEKLPRIQKLYDEFAELFVEVRGYQLEQRGDEIQQYQNNASKQLSASLKRIYTLEGGRELMERAQKEALEKIDRFEKELEKKYPHIGSE